MRLFPSFFVLAILLLAGCAGPSTQYKTAGADEFNREVQTQQALARGGLAQLPRATHIKNASPRARLAVVAKNVLTAAAPYCGDRVTRMVPVDIELDEGGPPLAFGLQNKAGSKTIDRIRSINGYEIDFGAGGVAQVRDAFAYSEQSGAPLDMVVQRGQRMVRTTVAPVERCSFGVVYKPEKEVNAYADGRNLYVHEGLINLMPNDDALASVVAHELAHNVMDHVSKGQSNVMIGQLLGSIIDIGAQSQGVNTQGQFGKVGAYTGRMQYSQAFEKEADYVGVYFLTAAGYNPNGAVQAMRVIGADRPEGISQYGSTHPPTAERVVLLEKSIAEIQAKQRARQPLWPEMRPVDSN